MRPFGLTAKLLVIVVVSTFSTLSLLSVILYRNDRYNAADAFRTATTLAPFA
jgi:hypothetical protein